MRMLDLIAAKRQGRAHTPKELAFIAQGAASHEIPEYQLSAWLMAVCCRGMNEAETVALTRSMAESGKRLSLASGPAALDKHSTGGVGDGISIALAPLIAAAGLQVPMMSGRGLGHTGGTLDKLESIKGLEVKLPVSAIKRQLSSIGVCMFGQSQDLAPADRKLYHLRDATSTVESLPLIVASILSKKMAEDLDALVLDVKIGSGAIFAHPAKGRELARALVKTAKGMGLKCAALLTAMEQPLGRYVGNALEIRQAVEILKGDFTSSDYADCLFALGGWMLKLGGKAKTAEAGAARLRECVRDGSAVEKLRRMIKAQGGDPRVVDRLELLPVAKKSLEIPAPASGYVSRLDARIVGEAAVALGAGRSRMDQALDYGAGLILYKKVGEPVKKGEPVAELRAATPALLENGRAKYLSGLSISSKRAAPGPVVLEVLS
jgi:pyrimidine-nucleoside phosphorylase